MKSEEVKRTEEQHCHNVFQFSEISFEENEGNSDVNSRKSSEALPKIGKYNTRDVSNIVLTVIRHHTELRDSAEIATVAWIYAGLISHKDSSLAIDHKIRKAQKNNV